MNKKKIKSLYKLKIKLFHKFNESYFDKNSSLVSDQEYDSLKNEILEL